MGGVCLYRNSGATVVKVLSNARSVDQRPGVSLLIVGKLTTTPITCDHLKMWPLGCAPGSLDLLDDVSSALPDKGAGLLSIGVTRITFDGYFH
jgi:hypothetical protein